VSNLEADPAVAVVGGLAVEGPTWELLDGREVVLGGTRARGTTGLTVYRTLPNRTRRMVGAWCFLDNFGEAGRNHRGGAGRNDRGEAGRNDRGGAGRDRSGPAEGAGMDVPPHPHTGLQTVTWLLDGTVVHHDSLDNTQLIRPGQLNLMTAGRGIAHAEVSSTQAPSRIHGVQLWVALPDASRGVEPRFEHHAELPTVLDPTARVRVLAGELAGRASPARTYTPLVGAEVRLEPDAQLTLPLEPDFEHAILALTGPVEVDGVGLEPGPLLYLGLGRTELSLAAPTGTTALLLGGEPFAERIVMWWNFIGRSHDEIVADRADWMTGARFGRVTGYDGDPLPAPEMPTTPLLPRGRTR
jgi:redox-sensitive bicupin YhaK (pirin superfamily)